jgi:hypothetical protein
MKSGGKPRWARAAVAYEDALAILSKGLAGFFTPAPSISRHPGGRKSRTPRRLTPRAVRLAAYKRQRTANRERRRLTNGK